MRNHHTADKASRFTFHVSRAFPLEALLVGGALVGYSNGLAMLAGRRGGYPEMLFRRLNPLVVVLMLIYAALRPGGWPAVGLRRGGLARSLLGGVWLGLGLSVPPLFFFYKPILLDTPLEYGPISGLSRRELLDELFIRLPVGVGILEELGFRGLLYAALRRHYSPAVAIGGSALGFAAWHYKVTASSAAQTNISTAARLPKLLRPYIQPIAVGGGMLTTGLAGVAFGILRERTGNLAGPMLAHWIVDGIMVVALWMRSPASRVQSPESI
jgi:membrane protease YdiL (CAAX protease family)